MSFRYAFVFLLLALALGAGGAVVRETTVAAGVAMWYSAGAFAWLSVGYAGFGPRVFCKRRKGTRHPVAWLLLGPYFLLNNLTFWLYRRGKREPAFAQAGANLYFGRRLTESEAAVAVRLGWLSILDLAPEFSEARSLRTVARYRSEPILDATAPTLEQLDTSVQWLRESLHLGPAYVHCALGHGRTATVVLAYLLATGAISSVADGLEHLRSLRRGVDLDPPQAARLKQLARRSSEAGDP